MLRFVIPTLLLLTLLLPGCTSSTRNRTVTKDSPCPEFNLRDPCNVTRTDFHFRK